MTLTPCPQCGSEYTYEDGNLLVCPMCGHEWSVEEKEEEIVYRDANGNLLKDGDAVTIIRDLKVKGASSVIKQGTKVKSIRLIEPVNGHNIDCKIDGYGQIYLKTDVVKKI